MENVQETDQDPAATSLLNKFILGQLKEKGSNGEIASRNGFVLPKLQLGSQTAAKFVIPPLKLQSTNTFDTCNNAVITTTVTPILPPTGDNLILSDNIVRLSGAVKNLRVNDQSTLNLPTSAPAIDLTAALSSVTDGINGSVRGRCTAQEITAEDFEIPFIECDRQERPILLPNLNANYQLETDFVTLKNRKCLAGPSPCGRIICLSYRHTCPLPYIAHNFKVKHKIQRFRFDSKSPDDIVLAAMNKYHRQY